MRNIEITWKERVLDFFNRNPDEELSMEDAMAKWPASRSRAIMNLNSMAKTGELGRYVERTQKQGRRWIYTAPKSSASCAARAA
jgi:hypothetical protein